MNLTLSLKAFLLFLPPRVRTFSTWLISITGNLRVQPTRFSSEGIQSAIFVMELGWNIPWWVTERSIPSGLTLLDVHTVQTGSYKLVSWEFLLGGESGQCSEASKYMQIAIASSCLLLPSQMWRSVLCRLTEPWLLSAVCLTVSYQWLYCCRASFWVASFLQDEIHIV